MKLPVLGTYSATAPYDCPKSKRIIEQGCKALAARVGAPGYRQNPITRSLIKEIENATTAVDLRSIH